MRPIGICFYHDLFEPVIHGTKCYTNWTVNKIRYQVHQCTCEFIHHLVSFDRQLPAGWHNSAHVVTIGSSYELPPHLSSWEARNGIPGMVEELANAYVFIKVVNPHSTVHGCERKIHPNNHALLHHYTYMVTFEACGEFLYQQEVQIKRDVAKHGRDLYLYPPKKFKHLTRAEELVITRLRIGHTKATKSHILSRGPPTACQHCGQTLTIELVFLVCTVLQQIRDEYYTADSLRTLFETIPETCIVEFLREAGFFYLIWMAIYPVQHIIGITHQLTKFGIYINHHI